MGVGGLIVLRGYFLDQAPEERFSHHIACITYKTSIDLRHFFRHLRDIVSACNAISIVALNPPFEYFKLFKAEKDSGFLISISNLFGVYILILATIMEIWRFFMFAVAFVISSHPAAATITQVPLSPNSLGNPYKWRDPGIYRIINYGYQAAASVNESSLGTAVVSM